LSVNKLTQSAVGYVRTPENGYTLLGDEGVFFIPVLQKLVAALDRANASNTELMVSQTALEKKEKVAQDELLKARQTLASTKSTLQEVVREAAEEKIRLEKKVAQLEEATAKHKAASELATAAVRRKKEEIAQLHNMVQGVCQTPYAT
jgi:polyribonucleotide nucleotidyltransferase